MLGGCQNTCSSSVRNRNNAATRRNRRYRSWLSSIGTGLDVTKLLMRHTTIAMSMDGYGEPIGDEASNASRKIAELAFRGNGAQAERESR